MRGGGLIAQADHLIFLNRTCFNGLYRVNRHGAVNVPMGWYDRPLLSDRDNLRRVHEALSDVVLLTGDYPKIAPFIDETTFVYLDPPYRPLSETASFTACQQEAFTDADQERLASFFRAMRGWGAALMLSNSDPTSVAPSDAFFDRLYAGFTVHRLTARRAINSRTDRRGPVTKLLITNYDPPASLAVIPPFDTKSIRERASRLPRPGAQSRSTARHEDCVLGNKALC